MLPVVGPRLALLAAAGALLALTGDARWVVGWNVVLAVAAVADWLRAPRPGSARAPGWLRSPAALALRLQRASILGWATALAVSDGRLVYVGGDVEALTLRGHETESGAPSVSEALRPRSTYSLLTRGVVAAEDGLRVGVLGEVAEFVLGNVAGPHAGEQGAFLAQDGGAAQ